MRCALLFTLLLFALPACAHLPEQPQALMQQLLATDSEAYSGYTTCGTRPRSWIADDQLDPQTREDSISLAGLRAHEAAHREIAARFPTCQDYMAWLAVPLNRLQTEAFAFCAQAHVEFELGNFATLDGAFAAAGRALRSPVYPAWPITDETAADLVRISCQRKAAPDKET
jgi:hypothetical protein